MRIEFRPAIFPNNILSFLPEIIIFPLISLLIFFFCLTWIKDNSLPPLPSYLAILILVILLDYGRKYFNSLNNMIIVDEGQIKIKNSNSLVCIKLSKLKTIERKTFIPTYLGRNTASPSKYRLTFKGSDLNEIFSFTQWDKITINKFLNYIQKTHPQIEIKTEDLYTSKDFPTFSSLFK